MAVAAIVRLALLDGGLVLAPERYDPRRDSSASEGVALLELVEIVNEQVDPRKATQARQFLVLDTGDAQEGVVRPHRTAIEATEIGSVKKRVQAGDVIISRLRPYLRQVALVDEWFSSQSAAGVETLCSTEFYVLRARDKQSIAFIVAFLLSSDAQKVLVASQEGGHHPRVPQRSIETLRIPSKVLQEREEFSRRVQQAVDAARSSWLELRALTEGPAAGG